jgi:hypothetical protein
MKSAELEAPNRIVVAKSPLRSFTVLLLRHSLHRPSDSGQFVQVGSSAENLGWGHNGNSHSQFLLRASHFLLLRRSFSPPLLVGFPEGNQILYAPQAIVMPWTGKSRRLCAFSEHSVCSVYLA